MNYTDFFLKYKCAGDVMNAVAPIQNASKEISESMSILRRVKPLTLKRKMHYNILDLCAGNCLTSVMSVFTLPVVYANAIDIRPRPRSFNTVKRFIYTQTSIYEKEVFSCINSDTIIISSHPCKRAIRIAEIYMNSEAAALCMIPCCESKSYPFPNKEFLKPRIGGYDVWCLYLSSLVPGSRVTKDESCLSPKNNIIFHEKSPDS